MKFDEFEQHAWMSRVVCGMLLIFISGKCAQSVTKVGPKGLGPGAAPRGGWGPGGGGALSHFWSHFVHTFARLCARFPEMNCKNIPHATQFSERATDLQCLYIICNEIQ